MSARSPFKTRPTEADRLRDMLRELHLSQRGAARMLGVNERTMRYWCAGDGPIPPMLWLALRAIEANLPLGP